jgi:hypothetical protein
MNKTYIQKGIIAGPVSSTVILFGLFFIFLASLFFGLRYGISIIIYPSIILMIALLTIVKKLHSQSYKSLTMLDNGLEYTSYFWKYSRFIKKTERVSWNEIQDISMLNKKGGIFKVQTPKETFTFFTEYASNNIDAYETIKSHIQKNRQVLN